MVADGIHLRWQVRVLVTASRNLTRQDVVDMWMLRMVRRAVREGYSASQILWAVGDCPTGGDLYAWEWMKANKVFFQRFEADWERYGKKMGGPMRNNLMIETIKPTHTLAFLRPESRGTVGCADRAQKISEVTRIYSPQIHVTHLAGTPVPRPMNWKLISETL